MPTYERLDYGSPDGSHWGGVSTDPVGFYGVTPVTRYADSLAASTYTVTSVAGSSFGFTTAQSFTSFVATVSSIQAALTRIGITV